MSQVELVVDIKNTLGEGPLWNVGEQCLYWVDIQEHKFFRLNPGNYETFDVGQPIGALAPNYDGKMLLALRDGLGYYDFDSGKVTLLEDNIAHQPPGRFNDGAVDRKGRFWAGTMTPEPESHLFCLDLDGTVSIHESSITTSNGIGWSPDNTIMYYSDTGPGKIFAYDFDLEMGKISNRRVLFDSERGRGKPDGLTVDSEGYIWAGFWGGWHLARISPDGEVVQEIDMPVERVTSCNFGGPDLKTLYITTANTGMTDADWEKQPSAGSLFKAELDVAGIPEPVAQIKLS